MLSVGLFLSLVSVSLAVELPGFYNNTQCVFVPSTRVFTCQYGESRLECSAVANFSVFGNSTYNLFGIAKPGESLANVSAEAFYFNLYPRDFDNVTYIGGERVVLYYGKNFVSYGVRVIDIGCFKQIIELFGGITDYRVVKVGSTPVSLIGEILINDAIVQKRWLLGYGFGYGFPYYGWGGLYGGYGLGYGLGFGYPGYFLG